MPTHCAITITNSTDKVSSSCPALSCRLQLVLLEAGSSCIPSLQQANLQCLLNFSCLARHFHSAHVDTADDSEEEEQDSPLMQLHPIYPQPGQSQAFAPAGDNSMQPSRVGHTSSQKPPFSSNLMSGKLSTPCMPLLLAPGWQLCHSADDSSKQPHATYQSSTPSSPWGLAIPHGTHCSMACQVMTNKANCCIQLLPKVNKMYVHAW